ncbi:MAG: PhoH family protein [Candidatus Neomarinimicrobiota bacterium]|nr:PhoH family protein [Candidatus Neomarinimicrobiota bacterium]
MKKNIDISGIDALAFMGVGDQNIIALQKHVDAQIVIRGTIMHLNGKKDELLLIESIVKEMMMAINKEGFIEPSQIHGLLDYSNNGSKMNSVSEEDSTVILFTHKGSINARTFGQKKYLHAVHDNDIIFAIGPAGTGKTYQAVAMGVAALKNRSVDRIIITRPAVEAGEHLGFLPGDLKDKVDPYLTPLYDALNDMIQKDKLKYYLDNKIIEIAPLAYMRGRTLHNSFIILDEAQNVTPMQMKMFLTRLGVTSKAIITGDVTQIDLPNNNQSGLIDAVRLLKKIDGIAFVEFNENDVVRHRLVKNIIKAYAKIDNKRSKS